MEDSNFGRHNARPLKTPIRSRLPSHARKRHLRSARRRRHEVDAPGEPTCEILRTHLNVHFKRAFSLKLFAFTRALEAEDDRHPHALPSRHLVANTVTPAQNNRRFLDDIYLQHPSVKRRPDVLPSGRTIALRDAPYSASEHDLACCRISRNVQGERMLIRLHSVRACHEKVDQAARNAKKRER